VIFKTFGGKLPEDCGRLKQVGRTKYKFYKIYFNIMCAFVGTKR